MQNPDVKTSSGYLYVNTAENLAGLNQALRGASRVCFDTEADSLHHYFEKVCLIQLSFSGKNYILDPLADLDLTEFFEILSQKELIIHAADYDLRMLLKSFGFRPKAPVFDTMIAAQVLGYEKIGLAALAEKICGVILPKTGQKADWSQRPLSESLLKYASDDTQYLETIAGVMAEELQKLERLEWHREYCERSVRNAGAASKNEDKEEWRVKGSSKVDPEALVFVRELWKWRDEEARQKDRPPFMILRNEDLILIAEWRAKHRHSPLLQGPVFLKRMQPDKFARLEKAVQTADRIPPAQWPGPPPKREWSDDRPNPAKLERLITACKNLAAELKMEPSIIASRAALTAVVLNEAFTLEKMMEAGGLMRWQAQLILPAIKNL